MSAQLLLSASPEKLHEAEQYDFSYIVAPIKSTFDQISDLKNNTITPLLSVVTDDILHLDISTDQLRTQVVDNVQARVDTLGDTAIKVHATTKLRSADRKDVFLFTHTEDVLADKVDLLLDKLLESKPLKTKLGVLERLGMLGNHGDIIVAERGLHIREQMRQTAVNKLLTQLLDTLDSLYADPARVLANTITDEQLEALITYSEHKPYYESPNPTHMAEQQSKTAHFAGLVLRPYIMGKTFSIQDLQ